MGICSVLSSCLSFATHHTFLSLFSSLFTPCDLTAVSGVREIFAERPCLGNAQESEVELVGTFWLCFDLDLFSDQEISADSLLRSLRRFVQWHSEISNEFDQWATRERTQDGRHYCDLVCEVLSCVYRICSLEGRQMVGSNSRVQIVPKRLPPVIYKLIC